MTDVESILNIFNDKKPVSFRLPAMADGTVKLEFEFNLDEGEEWLIKHMRPSSLTWNCKQSNPIQVTANFIEYVPTKFESLRDWFRSKFFKNRRC